MNQKVEIGLNQFLVDGVEIGSQVVSWKYGPVRSDQPGTAMGLMIDRVVMEDGQPKKDDSGFCVYQQMLLNPVIKIDIDGAKPRIHIAKPGHN